MFKKFTVLVLAVGLFHVSGLFPSAFADNPVSESPIAELAAKPGDIGLSRVANPLPAPSFMACSANQSCPAPFDGPIMCTGNSSCQVFSYQISCDGQVIDCPCSIAPAGCNDPLFYCVCRSQGGTFNYCRVNFC